VPEKRARIVLWVLALWALLAVAIIVVWQVPIPAIEKRRVAFVAVAVGVLITNLSTRILRRRRLEERGEPVGRLERDERGTFQR
jgi:hypothetical protein